ncbi:unnamed protein product [Rangifer tarandus platyrhynchus]|uniref:Uncharacterized protein n=2 Tax=Rangifer tarandus platyrhynchus TaxID=3082113 RepID=A0ABN8YMN6_RANTA|nr:unnamed protein product [Rangifer tarandus platyrhynchus]
MSLEPSKALEGLLWALPPSSAHPGSPWRCQQQSCLVMVICCVPSRALPPSSSTLLLHNSMYSLRDARRGSLPDPLCEQLADTTFRAQAALHVLRVYPRDADPPTVPGPRPRSRPSEATGSRLKAVGYGCSAPETLSAT